MNRRRPPWVSHVPPWKVGQSGNPKHPRYSSEIARRRVALGLSQAALAEQLGTGHAVVERVERQAGTGGGPKAHGLTHWAAWSKLLGLTVRQFAAEVMGAEHLDAGMAAWYKLRNEPDPKAKARGLREVRSKREAARRRAKSKGWL